MAELPERLREAAFAHRPDRGRMLARVERGMAAPEREPAPGAKGPRRDRLLAPWMRVTAVAAAVAGAIGVGGLAVGAGSGGGVPGQRGVTSGGTSTSQSPAAASGASGSAADSVRSPRHGAGPGHHARGAGRSDAATAPAAPVNGRAISSTEASGSGDPHGGPVSAAAAPSSGVISSGSLDAHSGPYRTESAVKLTNAQPLTSLTVTLWIARTTGVSDTSSSSSAPGTATTVSVQGDYLVYSWTLGSGHTLAPGTYTFAGRFKHADNARDTSGDSYTVTANGTDGQARADGGF